MYFYKYLDSFKLNLVKAHDLREATECTNGKNKFFKILNFNIIA